MIRTQEADKSDDNNPWEAIIAATVFAVRATVHTTLQASPSQLVFGRDHVLNIPFEADWQLIRQRKQERIKESNRRENAKRIKYTYTVGQKVLISTDARDKYSTVAYKGPYIVQQVNSNGTLRVQMGPVTDTINIRRVYPYNE